MSMHSRIIAALAIALHGAAAQSIPLANVPTVAARWNSALTFQQFVAGDSSRREPWEKAYANAAPRVDSVLARARAVHGRFRVLIVAESWCSDALRAVPLLARLAERDSAIEVRLLRKADARELLQAHLLAGRAATPLVLIYDEQLTEMGVWTERPAPGGTVLDEFLRVLERAPSFCR
jgi:hypothetical protein